MTHRAFPAIASYLLSLCLLSIGASVANAQIVCPQPLAPAVPPAPPAPALPAVDQNHIFCGEVNGGAAGGFHSRPNTLNPATITILPATNTTIPAWAAAGIYNLNNFNITSGGVTANKAISTMFPDNCNQANVLAAIRHAAVNGAFIGGQFIGPSGPSCQAGAPAAPFNILVVFNGAGTVRTAYPHQ